MSERNEPFDVDATSVVCAGTAEAPHEPRRLSLADGTVVRCPHCGKCYQRSASWSKLSTATWPKPE